MTYEELSYAFDQCKDYHMISSEGQWSQDQSRYDINLSNVLTELIKKAGQYCDYYASDLFYDWEDVQKFLSESKDAGYENIFLFGFRKSGVDAKKEVLSASEKSSTSTTYRRILALRFRTSCFDHEIVTAELKDLTCDFHKITD